MKYKQNNFRLIGTLQIGYLDLGSSTDDEDTRKLKTPVYLKSSSSQQQQQQQQQQTTAKDEFSVPAPVITKVKARNVSNVLPKPVDKTEEVEEDYKEPWEE